jgi:transcriptional regulator with GAF, ATPase, and Fis domain
VLTESRWLLKRLRAHGASPDPLALRELKAITERAWRRAALSLTPELRRDMAKHLDIDALLHHSPSAPQAATFGDQASLAGVNISTPHLGHTQPMSRPSLRPHSPPDALERQVLTTSERFFRMLSLSRRIIGESDLKRLIPAALDIALSLSGAERGFVLIRDEDDGPFEIAFSADVHGKPIAEEDLKFSATIAREVARQGHPILTNDAGQDQRFGDARSVHQLQFTSILCVPIRDRHRILGCLYLDHTGNPEVFGGIVPRMMSSHADQVAIALLSARQAAEVRSERDELKRAQARIRALLQEKEALLMDLETRCNGLEEDLARERNSSGLRYNYENLIARAPSMVRVLSQVDRVVDTMLPVVIQGASGTGKEVIARAMHFNGPRRSGSFVPINCGALAETLLESELFGHKKGAFTGAFADRKGLFESASGGTLFLDEVGEMSLSMQVKLLRALQESKIRPVGAVHEIDVDVRVLAATNRDLVEMISAGTFREDLYYRLATLVVELPPLRERREDIPLLVRHILKRATKDSASTPPTVTGPAVALLMQHHWPGNIRQLENVIHASMVMCDDAITPEVLLPLMPRSAATAFNPPAVAVKMRPHPGRPPKCTREEILGAMELFEGNRARAAEHLGVSLRTLQRYLKQLYQGPDTA